MITTDRVQGALTMSKSEQLTKAIDATLIGIVHHPQLSDLFGDVFGEDVAKDVKTMLITLVNTATNIEKCTCGQGYDPFCPCEAHHEPPQKEWVCPVCGHEMTEEESKGYAGCPSGMHACQHLRIDSGICIPKINHGLESDDCYYCGKHTAQDCELCQSDLTKKLGFKPKAIM
jgi:hypothetical protein